MCAVDAGCDKMSSGSVEALCTIIGCTGAQCQLDYPKITLCDWDTHVECEFMLESCLNQPNALIRRGYPYVAGDLVRWSGDAYSEEQRRFARRCACYTDSHEDFIPSGHQACEKPIKTNYSSQSCMSACQSTNMQALRQRLIDFDCAVCGDGNKMPGREECDDGNLDVMDGCDHECKIEHPQAFNSTVIKSNASHLPGNVIVIWDHLPMYKHAAEYNLLHKILYYVIEIERRECPNCLTRTFIEHAPYAQCDLTNMFQNVSSTSCSFAVEGLNSGENVNITLSAWNVAGMGPRHKHSFTWVLLPTGDVRIEEIDNYPVNKTVQLKWKVPSDTGLGDDYSLPILSYFLEIASCEDFRIGDHLCSYWSEHIGPSHSSIVRDNNFQRRNVSNSSVVEFEYPIMFNIEYDLHPGFFYYYRLHPQNFLGRSFYSETLRAQYGEIAFESSILLFPVEFPMKIAVTPTGNQIWQDSVITTLQTSSNLQVAGFPLVRNLSEDLEMTIRGDGAFTPPGSTIVQTLTVVTTTLLSGTEFYFTPPPMTEKNVSECGRCLFEVNIRFRRWSSKSISFSMLYFVYPSAAMFAVSPYNGPVGGGTTIRVLVQDYEGPETRAGAGLPSFYSVAFDGQPLNISLEASGTYSAAQVIQVEAGSRREDFSRLYTVTMILPKSPISEPVVANIQFLVSGVSMTLTAIRAQTTFEFIGAKIMGVLPRSGYLNPGSGGAVLQVMVANMDRNLPFNITVAGSVVVVQSVSDPVPNDLGTVSAITVAVPEMPLALAGTLSINLSTTVKGLASVLTSTWQYDLPPDPVIDPESVVVDDNQGLWAPASAIGYAASLVVENLSPMSGIFYDEVQVIFDQTRANVIGFLQLGRATKINFRTPNKMSPGIVAAKVEAFANGHSIMNISNFKDGSPFELEFRDLSQPRILGFAPTEGPSRGGSILMIALISFAKAFDGGASVAASMTSAGNGVGLPLHPTFLGVVSAKDWVDKSPEYAKVTSVPEISSYFVGLNDRTQSAFDGLVTKVTSAVAQESFDVDVGMRQAGFAFFLLPEVSTSSARRLFSEDLEKMLLISVADINIQSNTGFRYTDPPQGNAVVAASSDLGGLKIGLDGNAKLTVSLSNFDTVYKAGDITLQSNGANLQVSRLLYSTQAETRLYIIPPPGNAGLIDVQLFSKSLPANVASFSFEYVDLRVPEVKNFFPFRSYQNGGVDITASLVLLPDVALADIDIDIYGVSATSTFKIDTVKAKQMTREGGIPPEDTATIVFALPRGVVGKANFVVRAAKKASTCPQTKLACQTFMYAAIPTTAPNLLHFDPSTVSSLGGTVLSLKVNNFKLIENPDTVRISIKAGDNCHLNTSLPHCSEALLKKMTHPDIQIVSTIVETRIRFTVPGIPEVLGGQNGKVRVWDSRNATLFTEFTVFFRDDSIAEIVYVYPSSIKSTSNEIVEVSIKRLGAASDPVDIFAAHDVSCDSGRSSQGHGSICTLSSLSNAAIANYRGSILRIAPVNDGLTVEFTVNNTKNDVAMINVTIVNRKFCPSQDELKAGNCRKKSASFTFDFRDPKATYIQSVDPIAVVQDGRVPVTLSVDNLPRNVDLSDMFVHFGSDVAPTQATQLEIRGETGFPGLDRAFVTFLAPASATATSLVPYFRIPSRNITVTFPLAFKYKTPPDILLVSFTPTTAPLNTASPVQIRVQNFPGIVAKSDIAVEFRWPNAKPVQAIVTGFQQVDTNKFATDVQEYLIDLESPTGNDVSEAIVVVNCFHVGYRGRQASLAGFKFIDTLVPQVSLMTTDIGTNGADAVEVRMSASTEVTVTVNMARVPITGIQVDSTSSDLVLSQHEPDEQRAKAVFKASSRITKDNIYGMAMFATSCGDACLTPCCADASCSAVCSCRVSCFQLKYFDDLAPAVSFVSPSRGQEVGGSVIFVKIKNFPLVTASEDASTEVVANFDSTIQSRTYVQSSSEKETALQVETPDYNLQGEYSKTIILSISPLSKPDLIMNINYVVEQAVPMVSGIVLPSKGTNVGGVRTAVRIRHFPFPSDAVIAFGEVSVPSTSISIDPSSSKHLSTIIFDTPATDPGLVTVKIVPKSCPNCGKSVSFVFDQIDALAPVVLQPVPTDGPWQEDSSATQAISVAPFPSVFDSFGISCIREGIIIGEIGVISVAPADGIASIVYDRPYVQLPSGWQELMTQNGEKYYYHADDGLTQSAPPPGWPSAGNIDNALCTFSVVYEGKTKSGTFSYNFYDGTAIRLVRLEPPQLATRISVYGRKLDLTQKVKLTFANFRLGMTPDDLNVMMGSSTVVSVLSVKDASSCPAASIDCDRTEVEIGSIAQDVARVVRHSISVINGNEAFGFGVPYFMPCDYEKFCSDRGELVDAQMLVQTIPTNNECELKYCVDPLSPNFPKASLQSFNPRQGPATGGTKVQAYFDNFPVFSTDDVTIAVGSGASTAYARALSVSNSGGTLLSSKGFVEFETPSIMNTGALEELDIELLVYVGSLAISLKETFRFTPVPVGRAILTGVQPQAIFPGVLSSITVRLSNFPLIPVLSDVSQIQAVFDSKSYTSSSILSSTYDATIATFEFKGNTAGSQNLRIFFKSHGEARATDGQMAVLAPPTPAVESYYPERGIAGRELSLRVTAKYLLPQLGAGDLQADLDGAALPVEDVTVLTAETCQTRDCAVIIIQIMIGKEVVSAAGGVKSIRITSNEDSLAFNFPFDPSTSPSLESLEPTLITSDMLATTTLTVYISNVPDTFCTVDSSCAATFVFGTGSQQLTRNGVITGGSFENSLRVLYIKPPLSPKGMGFSASLAVTDGSISVRSSITIKVPPPVLAPIDSPCTGGIAITVSAQGFGTVVTLPSEISASIGGKSATVKTIVSSSADDDSSLTVFTIVAPTMTESSRMPGLIQFSSVSIDFNFECFAQPQATTVPNKAMLSGQTSSLDGRTIAISMRSFPPLQTASDVQVRFGKILCVQDECGVESFTSSASSVDIVVSVPSVVAAQEVILMVEFVGKALPPEGGDPSKTYVRSRRFATSPFTYYVPAPEVVSALYCDQCSTGIATVSVKSAGAGYINGASAITDCSGINGCTGSGFSGTCSVSMGRVTGISVTESGSGYSESRLPAIVCTSGIASVSIVAPGANYTDSGSMLVDCPPPCTGTGLAGTCIADGISAIVVTAAGSNYINGGEATADCSNVPCNSKACCTGHGFTGTCTADGVASVTINAGGWGYAHRGAATMHCLDPSNCTGSGFLGLCVADGIAGILVLASGSGYADGAAATADCTDIRNCTGSGFVGTCVSNGITAVAVGAAGSNYTSGAAHVDCTPPCSGTGFAAICKADGIASVSIASAGTGYLDGANATTDCTGIPGCGGNGFAGTCFVTDGSVTSITITNPGSGYLASAPPAVKCDGGNSNMLAVPTLGSISEIIVSHAGHGYTLSNPPTISCPGGGFGLVTIPTVSTGITAIRIIQTGEGYVSTALPVIKCAGGNSDLVAIPTLGAVTKVIVQKIGSGYTADPLYTIKCAGGKDLNAVPNIGAVTAINIDKAGSGYSADALPEIKCSGGNSLMTNVSLGALTGVSIVNAGYGYKVSAPPRITCPGGSLGTLNLTYAGTGFTAYTTMSCMLAGRCGQREMALSSKMAISGTGTLIVVANFISQVSYNKWTGELNSSVSDISLQFGNYPGKLKRILFSEESRSAYEFKLDSLADPGPVTAELIVRKDITKPTTSKARFGMKLYDSNIQIVCEGGCEGQVEGASALSINVTNIQFPLGTISDTLVFTFAGVAGTDVQLVTRRQEYSVFVVIPPPYTCVSCTTLGGKATVNLAISYKATGTEISETKYTYWAAPKIESLRFDSTGGKVLMRFDALTNRANMSTTNSDCKPLFVPESISLIGSLAKCVWMSSRVLEIHLGRDATVGPGDSIVLSKSGGLRSSNGKSKAAGVNPTRRSTVTTGSGALLTIPEILVAPSIEIKCPETIDPCSALEIRATVISPRPPTYLWSCNNDDYLNDFLSTQGGDSVTFPPGTPSMRTLDKTYRIVVRAVDFLGTSSPSVMTNILKKASPTPQVQFNPPTETTTINKEVIIKGEAFFSSCPVQPEDLQFSWRQVSGPALPASMLSSQLPQLQIPPYSLKEGSTYQIALKLGMSTDASKASESIFVLQTGYQGLQAVIDGGASTAICKRSELLLSAAPSRDLDLKSHQMTETWVIKDGKWKLEAGVSRNPQGLTYKWSCTFFVNSVLNMCRNGTEILSLPNEEKVAVPPGILPVAEFPYVFTVTISKPGRSPAKYSKKVYVRDKNVPKISISGEGGFFRPDGSLYVSSQSRLIFTAVSDSPQCVQNRTRYNYTWIPPIFFNDSNLTNITHFNGVPRSPNQINHNGTNCTSAAQRNCTLRLSMYEPGITKDCINENMWSLQPSIQYNQTDAPFGFRRQLFVLNSNPNILITGNTYTLKFTGALIDGGVGEASLAVVVNSPPLSGKLSVCLVKPGEKGCIKAGAPIMDEFRASCVGWVDADLPLKYVFGYNVKASNIVNGSSVINEDETWFDAVADNSREMGFPLGSVTFMAYVLDAYDASTELLSDTITVSDAVVGGRRLLASMNFLEKAKAKLKASLQTFRADKINQMAGSMSGSSAGMSPDAAQEMKGNLLSTMANGIGRSTPTLGGQCESFSAAKTATSDAKSLGGSAVGGMAAMMKNMLKSKLSGGIPASCAANAAGAMGGSLKAQAMYRNANPGKPPMVDAVGAAEFMQSLETGMKQIMSQAVHSALVNEGPRLVSLDTAEHNINRISASSLKTGALFEKWSHPIPSMAMTTVPNSFAEIELPDTFAQDVFGDENPNVDVHTQSHGHAPQVPGFKMTSPLVGVTISYEKGAEIPVNNLLQPISVTIPVITRGQTPTGLMLFSQKVKCVWWNNHTYSHSGCNVSYASVTSVTCKCTHLTLFGIQLDDSMPACGDGVVQTGEECDDGNLNHRDGCNGECRIEPYCKCEGREPSLCTCLRPITTNLPEKAGVAGKVSMSGFTSKEDFLSGQAAFQKSLAVSLEIEGLDGSDVVVMKACHGSDCTQFWTLDSRRLLSGARADHVQQPRLRAQQTVVDFFVNVGTSSTWTTADIFKAFMRPTFASKFIAELSAMTGRVITASFDAFEIVESGVGFNKPGFGIYGDSDDSSGISQIFASADQQTMGLSIYIVIPVMCLFGLALMYGIARYSILPLIRKINESRRVHAEKKLGMQQATAKLKIDPTLKADVDQLQQDQGFKDLEQKKESSLQKRLKQLRRAGSIRIFDYYSGQEETEDLVMDDLSDGKSDGNLDGILEVVGDEMDTAEGESQHVVPAAANPTDNPWANPTSATLAESMAGSAGKGGVWNNARSRLAVLESQLDALLVHLPAELLPTPPGSADTEYDDEEKSVLHSQDSGLYSPSVAASARRNQLVQAHGRSSGVLKINVPRVKAKFHRPSIPETSQSQEASGPVSAEAAGVDDPESSQEKRQAGRNMILKPITFPVPQAGPKAGKIRRAPNLSSIFDDGVAAEWSGVPSSDANDIVEAKMDLPKDGSSGEEGASSRHDLSRMPANAKPEEHEDELHGLAEKVRAYKQRKAK